MKSIAAFALLLPFHVGPAPATAGTREGEIKAAYLMNILRLSQPKSFPVSGDLVLCLFRPGEVEEPLKSLENTLVHGRKLRLRTARKNEIDGCEVVFFGESGSAEGVLAKAHSVGALTVGSDTAFLSISGMIALVIENRRMVVEINQAALGDNRWTFSSHLLEIARVTQGGVR